MAVAFIIPVFLNRSQTVLYNTDSLVYLATCVWAEGKMLNFNPFSKFIKA